MYRHNQIIIDLDAIRHNYQLMADYLPDSVRVMAVVKANAYGHGMIEVAKTVTAAGCENLAVAIPEEGSCTAGKRHQRREYPCYGSHQCKQH